MKTGLGDFLMKEGLYSGPVSKSLGSTPADAGIRTPDSNPRRQKVAEEFASLLLLEVLKAMRATLSEKGILTDGDSSQAMYTSLVDMEVARALAKRDGLGLARFVLEGMKEGGQETRNTVRESGDKGQGVEDRIHGTEYSPSLHSLLFPVLAGKISSPFGLRLDPFAQDQRFHAGVDIAAPVGSPIRAVAAGRVVFSGPAGGYGNLVTIGHGDGLTTRYAHIGESFVSVGQRVTAGQEIALVGTSGRSTGPHLHFEVRKQGDPINPQAFLTHKRS